MYTHTPTLCNEILNYVNRSDLDRFSGQLKTDKRSKKFSTRKLFLTVFMGHALWASSTRELETTMNAQSNKLYHMWLDRIHRSTVSDWINKIPSIVFEHMFYELLWTLQKTIGSAHRDNNIKKIYAIDSTLISLTLSVFDWAHYRKRKGWIKLHTRLDITSALPDLIHITDAKIHDRQWIEPLLQWLQPKDIVLFDRWYLDYSLLYGLQKKDITFVTRTKQSTQYQAIQHNDIVHPCIQYDALCEFIYPQSYASYPGIFRVVRYTDAVSWKTYEYITNNFVLSAEAIADLYKQRRQIELLFKRLKQNLRIKQFFWTSRNAVESQVWIALIYYLIVILIKTKTRCRESLLELTRKLRILLFERVRLLYVLWISTDKVQVIIKPPPNTLFDFV